MKFSWMRGLVLLPGLCFALNLAAAESGPYAMSPLANTSATPLDGAMPASYSTPTGASYTRLSSFSEGPAEAAPEATTARTEFEDAVHSPCCDECNSCCSPSACCGCRWFGSVGALVMGRNRPNPFWTTYETNNNVNQLMNTAQAGMDWNAGGQVTLGYNFCCGPAIAFTYWGVGPITGEASRISPTNELSTPINLETQTGPVMIGPDPASDFFDNSFEHRITRDDRFNNFEINLLQGTPISSGPVTFSALAGFRYFRLDERLAFTGTFADDPLFDDDDDEATLAFRTVNNLFGAQIGGVANWQFAERWGLFLVPKVGVFSNWMYGRALLARGDGVQGFDILSSKTDVSMLGEIDFGLNYAITAGLRAYVGYRVLGITNVALGDNQFLPYLADQQGFGEIKQSGSMILHGSMAGLAWLY